MGGGGWKNMQPWGLVVVVVGGGGGWLSGTIRSIAKP